MPADRPPYVVVPVADLAADTPTAGELGALVSALKAENAALRAVAAAARDYRGAVVSRGALHTSTIYYGAALDDALAGSGT